MNNFFNFNRFALLIQRQWVENRKLFLMAMLVVLGIGIVYYCINLEWETGQLFSVDGRTGLFFAGLYLAGSLFTNYVFKDLSDKNSSTSYLLVPASHFEKLLSGFFYVIIVFPIVYSITFYLLDAVFVSISNSIIDSHKSMGFIGIEGDYHSKRVFENLREIDFVRAKLLLPIYLAIQTFMMLGSISFMRWSFVKTGFMGFAILLIVGLMIGFINHLLLEDLSNQLGGSQSMQMKPINDTLDYNAKFTVKYVLTPLFLIIAYFKLKEKQI
jgi:hypothetical protein